VLWILWTTLVLAGQATYVSGYGLCITTCVQGCGLWISDHPQALSTGYPPVIHRVRPPSGDNPSRTSLTFCRWFDHSSDASTALPHVLPRSYPQTVDGACVQRVVIRSLVTLQLRTVVKSWHKASYPQVVWKTCVDNSDKPGGGICPHPVDCLGTTLWTTYGHKRPDPRSAACGNSG
jgi:hypothetical protein